MFNNNTLFSVTTKIISGTFGRWALTPEYSKLDRFIQQKHEIEFN